MLEQYFAQFGLTGGVLIIIGVGLVLFLIIAIVLERRTKMLFPERDAGNQGDDFLSDDEDGDN